MGIINKLRSLFQIRKELLLSFKVHANFIAFQKNWREINAHNGTVALNCFPTEKVTVGKDTYGGLKVLAFDNPEEALRIGSYCSIADSVTFLLGGEHGYKTLSSYPIWTHVLHQPGQGHTPSKGPILVEDDVWIGCNSTILSGVTIGRGAIIGAGSVVTKSVPPYGIWAGGKVIRYRFSGEIIERIKDLPLDNIQKLTLEQQRFICTQPLDEQSAEMICQWLQAE